MFIVRHWGLNPGHSTTKLYPSPFYLLVSDKISVAQAGRCDSLPHRSIRASITGMNQYTWPELYFDFVLQQEAITMLKLHSGYISHQNINILGKIVAFKTTHYKKEDISLAFWSGITAGNLLLLAPRKTNSGLWPFNQEKSPVENSHKRLFINPLGNFSPWLCISTKENMP